MAVPDNRARAISEPGRLIGIFWEPRPVFEDLSARPRWWVPLILLTVLALGYIYAFANLVGWDVFIRQQFETNERLRQMSVEQQFQIMQQQMKLAPTFGYVGAIMGVGFSTIVISAVMLGVFNFAGGASLKYKQAYSITVYSLLPTGVSSVLSMVVMSLKNPADFDLQNPLALNVGAFLDPQATPKWLYSLGTSLDVFSAWVVLLLALGFSVASQRLRFSKSLALVACTWAIYAGLKSGWASLFG
jgi:hypothetical protein